MCSIDDEARWGPFVQNDECGTLTFTLLFQEIIFSIIPASCGLIAAALRAAYLWSNGGSTKARKTAHYFIKLASLSILSLGLQLPIVILVALNSNLRTRASIADAVLRLSGSLAFVYLSHLEHTRTCRPSHILVAFFTLSICLDGIRMRTLWTLINSNATAFAGVFTASVIMRVVVLVVESWDKASSLVVPFGTLSPESTTGFLSRLTFWWLAPLLRDGFKTTLVVDKLFVLDDKLKPEALSSEMSKLELERMRSLLITTVKEHKKPLLLGALFRLLFSVCTFSQPFLIEQVTKFGSGQNSPGKPVGTWLVVAYGFVYAGMAISTAGQGHQTNKLVIGVRGSLTMRLYRSMLNMTENEAQGTQSAELTLVSSDMEKICYGLQTIHFTWASILDIGLSVWLLQRLMHLATVGPVLFAVACVCVGGLLGSTAGAAQASWLETIQARVHATSGVLSSLRYVQMASLGDVVASSISKMRETEIAVSKKYRGQLVWIVTISHLTSVVCPILGLTVFALSDTVNHGGILTSSRAFSSLTTFLLLGQAVGNFVPAALGFMVVISCFGRFTKFMTPQIQKATEDNALDLAPPRNSSQMPAFGASTSEIPLQNLPDGFASTSPSFQASSPTLPTTPDYMNTCATGKGLEIGWKDAHAVFSDMSFTIPRGRFTMITGDSGSGKSTLLKTLLRETEIRAGVLHSNIRNAAFCSQKPWLVNDTFMNNVTGISPYDQAWFQTVTDACGLREDIRRLPFGNETAVGMEGLRLSGGQRVRLALARAVYCREDVLILDDVLRGSDPRTADHILNALFGPQGILRRSGATVICATGNGAFRDFADHIIDLNDTTAETAAHNKADSKVFHAKETKQDDVASEGSHSNRSSMQSNVNFLQIKGPETSRIPTDSAIYLYYSKTLGRSNTVVFLLLCSIVVFGLSFPQVWIAWWTAAIEDGNTSKTPYYVGIYFLLGGIAVLALISGAWQLLLRMIPRSAMELHETILTAAIGATLTFLTTHGSGQIINRFSQDLGIIDTDVPIGFYQTVFTALSAIAQAVFMCLGFKYNAVAVPFCLGLLYLIQKFYLRTARQLRVLDLESKATLLAHISSTILGRVTIRSLGWDKNYTRETVRLLDLSLRAHYLLLCVQQWLRLVLGLIVAVLSIGLASLSVFLGSSTQAGFLGVSLTGLVNFSASLSALITSWTYLETAIQAVVRIKTFTAGRDEDDADKAVLRDVPAGWPSTGKIEFNGVSVVYENGARPVLQNLNFAINSGERVGLCGRTGSGKSSIVSSLLRCVDLCSGSIAIDGIDISSISPHLVRSSVLNMSQENFILPGTIRWNIDPHGSLSHEDLVSLLKEVMLWDHIHENGGLEADAGKCLSSSSQAQLLCLARILRRQARIVIMDEATSSLNRDAAKLIRSKCRENFAGSTLLIISHTLEELVDCDRVIVLDAGEIVEFDSPSNLMKDENSAFRRLFRVSVT